MDDDGYEKCLSVAAATMAENGILREWEGPGGLLRRSLRLPPYFRLPYKAASASTAWR
ncbi:hypothetical protein J19TS2_36610 [Cohnella xylanilytica]|nr:hypothetical protein J19TS2_36610 [Cohnella xylanilytica]